MCVLRLLGDYQWGHKEEDERNNGISSSTPPFSGFDNNVISLSEGSRSDWNRTENEPPNRTIDAVVVAEYSGRRFPLGFDVNSARKRRTRTPKALSSYDCGGEWRMAGGWAGRSVEWVWIKYSYISPNCSVAALVGRKQAKSGAWEIFR